MLGPILAGEKISLEPPQTDDLETFRGWFADLSVTRYLLMRFAPSAEQEEEWLRRVATGDSQVNWRIRAEGRTIGSTSIENIDWINRRGITGTVIGDRSQWGKGYGTEVVRLRSAYAFEELGLERLDSESMAENLGMHRALERSGYQKIGRRRRHVYRGGVWHDAFLFELLREDWLAHRDESSQLGNSGR